MIASDEPEPWCGHCGAHGDGLVRCLCVVWQGTPDEIESLIESVADDRRLSRNVVSSITRRDLLAVVERLAVDDRRPARAAAAVEAVAHIASEGSLPLVLELIEQGRSTARSTTECIRFLARVGTPPAIEHLASMLSTEELAPLAAMALAAVGDVRATPTLLAVGRRRLFTAPSTVLAPEAVLTLRGDPLAGLAHLRDPAALPELVELLEQASDLQAATDRRRAKGLADLDQRQGAGGTGARAQRFGRLADHVGVDLPRPDPGAERLRVERRAAADARSMLSNVALAVEAIGGPRARGAVDDARRTSGLDAIPFGSHASSAPHDAPEPLADEPTVPAWTLDIGPGPADHPGTRFGGSPTWRDRPTWPVGPTGAPLAFWGQFELPWDRDRMAYLFVDCTDGYEPRHDAETVALFVQPGGRPATPWMDRERGPAVPGYAEPDHRPFPAPTARTFDARIAQLSAFTEPAVWRSPPSTADRNWRKAGGTPLFLQPAPHLDARWRFLFEFGASEAGREIGDVAQCYGFVDDETGDGRFHWDCH